MSESNTQTKSAKKKSPAPKGKPDQKCQIEGCKRAYQAKGYCFFHYDKWKKGELPKARHKVKPPQKAAAGAPAAAAAPTAPAAPAAS